MKIRAEVEVDDDYIPESDTEEIITQMLLDTCAAIQSRLTSAVLDTSVVTVVDVEEQIARDRDRRCGFVWGEVGNG